MNFEKILEQFQTDLENYRKENDNKHPMNQDFWFSQFETDIDELQEIVDGILGFDFQISTYHIFIILYFFWSSAKRMDLSKATGVFLLKMHFTSPRAT